MNISKSLLYFRLIYFYLIINFIDTCRGTAVFAEGFCTMKTIAIANRQLDIGKNKFVVQNNCGINFVALHFASTCGFYSFYHSHFNTSLFIFLVEIFHFGVKPSLFGTI